MKVLLTFDVEVWCGGWDDLDRRFPSSFDRYVFGRSAKGEFALPRTLGILREHGLQGVFFVEALFASRFGAGPLRAIVDMIGSAGHDIQLHVHPEWADEATPSIVPSTGAKRPYLHQYSASDQRTLIETGIALLCDAGVPRPTAFRAGSFAAGSGTFASLAMCGIRSDFSIDATMPESVPEWRGTAEDLVNPRSIDGVACWPMAVFHDGFSRQRHAQVGACSSRELTEAIEAAQTLGWETFVILSHNFEMLKPGSVEPDIAVVRRFENLCAHLATAGDTLSVSTTRGLNLSPRSPQHLRKPPRVSTGATTRRLLEQVWRRIV